MAIAKIEDINGEECEITLADGRKVRMLFTGDSVELYDGSERCGEFEFHVWEEPGSDGQDVECAKLKRAFNERFANQGVGTEAVRYFLFQAGIDSTCLEFPDDDGIRRDDGGHLTGDGPGFVKALRRKIDAGEL